MRLAILHGVGRAKSKAQLDPGQELLLEEFRSRAMHPLTRRERVGEAVAACAFVATAAAMASLIPWQQSLSLPLAASLVLAYAIVSRIRFEAGPCYTTPTQLVFVPMLFLIPAACVPLAVAAGNLASDLPSYLRGARHPERALLRVGDSWYAVGPALVLGLAAAGDPSLADWPLYLGALAAQFAIDALTTTPREWYEQGVAPKDQLASIRWTDAVDAALSPIGLCVAAFAVSDGAYAFMLVLPLALLLANFAREREARLDAALLLGDAYRGTTTLLADLVEADDLYTGVHSRAVVTLSLEVADELELEPALRRNVEFGALLHDVGKIHVPKEIIGKPGPLTEEEWHIVQLHTVDGQHMLDRVGGTMRDVGRVVRSSHERWDGTGYPDGLAGEQIPIEARIVSCCDAFNAMTTDRPYRRALPHDIAMQELHECAGTQFDRSVVEALVAAIDKEAADRAVPVAT